MEQHNHSSKVDVVQSTELEWPPMCYDLPECRDGWPSSVYEWNTWFRSKKGVSGIYQKLFRVTIISPQWYDRENKMSIREPTPHVHTSTRPHHVASQTSGVNFLQSPTVRLGGGAVEPKLNFVKLLGRSNKLKKMRGQNAKQETSKVSRAKGSTICPCHLGSWRLNSIKIAMNRASWAWTLTNQMLMQHLTLGSFLTCTVARNCCLWTLNSPI